MTSILPRLIERFFTQRLMRQRNVSPHTIASYRDTFKLFLKFTHRQTGCRPSSLQLEAFNAELVVPSSMIWTSSAKQAPRPIISG